MEEIQKYQEGGQVERSGGLSLSNPSDVMSFANTLRKFISENKLSTTIQKREYVNVDGWKFAGLNFGLTAIAEEPVNISSEKPIKVFWKDDLEGNSYILGITSDPDEIARLNERKPKYVKTIPNYKYKCNCKIVNISTGEQIGFGNAMCSNEEKKKVSFDEYAIASMAQCVPVRAQILTKEGFKYFNQLQIGEPVLSYDCETDQNYWTPLEDVNVFPDAFTYKLENRSFLAYCTDEHTWAVKSRSNYNKLTKTRDLKNGNIVLAAKSEGGFSSITPEESYMMGWILTDGTIRWTGNSPRIHIDQSKAKYVKKIREAFKNLYYEAVTDGHEREFPTGKTYYCKPSHRFSLSSETSRWILSKFNITSKNDTNIFKSITDLSSESRSAMLQAMLEADGSSVRGTSWNFGKKNEVVMQVFQILATMEGYGLGRMTNDNGFPRQMMRSFRVAQIKSLEKTKHSREPVWCPTTKYGTWVMKIDGNVMITGNTRAIGKAFRNLLGFIMNAAGFEDTPAEEMTEDYAKNNGNNGGKKQPKKVNMITEEQKTEIQKLLENDVLSDIREATLSAMDNFSQERAANCINYLKNEKETREQVINDEQNS